MFKTEEEDTCGLGGRHDHRGFFSYKVPVVYGDLCLVLWYVSSVHLFMFCSLESQVFLPTLPVRI